MRFFMILFFLLTAHLALSAETVLVCHSQVLPKDHANPGTETALVDTVFSSLFESGAITFDLSYDPADAAGDTVHLTDLARKYGADKVVWLRLVWEPGVQDGLKLQKVNFRVLDGRGDTLGSGLLTIPLETPSVEQKKQTEKLSATLSGELNKIWASIKGTAQ
ncbi:MAG: hypothetical protein HKM06_07325 [Spirochaetales bacterium]|nr:hypothetical protein [Spirochaetales bacterium]